MKSLLFVTCLSLILALGCGKKEEKKTEAPKETQKVETPAEVTQVKELTEEDFIEYYAHLLYLTEKYEGNEESPQLAQEVIKLCEKVGIKEKKAKDALEALGKKFEEWIENWRKKVGTDPEKVAKEFEKLMEKVEKRVAELKAGK